MCCSLSQGRGTVSPSLCLTHTDYKKSYEVSEALTESARNMASYQRRAELWMLVLMLGAQRAAAQASYGPGAIAGVFFGTFLGTVALCAAAFAIWYYVSHGK